MKKETQEEVSNKIVNKISNLHTAGHLRPGANKIHTRINGIETIITIYIKDDVPQSINTWVPQ